MAQAANLEQVGCFAGSLPGLTESCKPVAEEHFGEEVQLGGTGGMAVNYTGAGGVPEGTVYATRFVGGGLWIAMYVPAGEGLKLAEAWQVTELKAPTKSAVRSLGLNGEPGEHPLRAAERGQ